jgi:hypothetical protein
MAPERLNSGISKSLNPDMSTFEAQIQIRPQMGRIQIRIQNHKLARMYQSI